MGLSRQSRRDHSLAENLRGQARFTVDRDYVFVQTTDVNDFAMKRSTSAATRGGMGMGLAASMVLVLLTVLVAGQEKLPKVFEPYFEANRDYEAERITVVTPEEIEKYLKLVEEGAAKNPEWYSEYSQAAKPGAPLPYHKNLNLTPKEYQEYLALWAKREVKAIEKVGLRLEFRNGNWRVLVGGRPGTVISLLRYDEKNDLFLSTNGKMVRIEDIDAAADTLLGEWKGVEWRYEEESGLGKMKENFGMGKTSDGKYGFLVYRLQDVTSSNRLLLDQSVIIRFPLG